MIEKKGIYRAKIESLKLMKAEGSLIPHEGDVIFSLMNNSGKEIKLECFLSQDVLLNRWMKLIKGKEVFIKLKFVQFEYKKNQRRNKSIKLIKQSENAVNSYQINGEVLKLTKDRVLSILLDADLDIETNVQLNEKIKVGDYLYLEGRLDAEIVKI